MSHSHILVYTFLAFIDYNIGFVYSHAELILEKGVIIMTKHPNFIQGDSKYTSNHDSL